MSAEWQAVVETALKIFAQLHITIKYYSVQVKHKQ